MARLKQTSLFLILSFHSFVLAAQAQHGYWYTSAKVPLADFIATSLKDDSESINKDKFSGVGIDLGRGFAISKSFFIETGVEYMTANTWNKKFYQDKRNFHNSPYKESQLYNSTFSFQLRPVFSTLSDDNEVGFNAGVALGYQKLLTMSNIKQFQSSKAMYTSEVKSSSSSNFSLNIQPSAGIRIKLADHYSIALDVNYMNINWNKSLSKLSSDQSAYLPNLKTRDIFFCGRVIID